MVLHVCPRCHYQTSQKGHIRCHYNKKTKCKPLFSDITIEDCIELLNTKKIHICEHCDKRFSRSDSLKRHKEKCYEKRLKILEEENKIMKKKLEGQSLSKLTNINSNNTTNNITNNIQININNFDQTNYQIALEDLKNSIKQSLLKNNGYNMNIECENLVELVHCNDKYPENHNILITDRNRKEARIKDGDRFKVVPKDDIIEQTASNIINLLKDNKLFSRYIRFHEKKDDDTILEDKKSIERTLYNNRDKIMNTAKEGNIKI